MNNYGKYFVLFLTMTFFSSINSFVSYYMLTKDDKVVLLLGDLHKSELNELNEKDADKFLAKLDYLSKKLESVMPLPIPFVIELNEDSVKPVMEQSSGYKFRKTFTCVYKYIAEKNCERRFISHLYDPRTEPISTILNGVCEFLTDRIVQGQEQDCDFKSCGEAIRKLFSSATGILTEVDLRHYLKSLDDDLERLNKWGKQYFLGETLVREFELVKERYTESLEKAKSCFENEDLSLTLPFALLNIVDSYDNFTDALGKVLELEKSLIIDMDFVIADIGFLSYILEQQQQHNKILFLAGALHADKIADLLQKQGYILSDHHNALIKYDNIVGVNTEELSEIPDKLNDCLKSFLDPAFPRSVETYKKCFWCQETDVRELTRCGRCKNAYYCGRNCQKQHWLWHKSVCKAN